MNMTFLNFHHYAEYIVAHDQAHPQKKGTYLRDGIFLVISITNDLYS